MDLKGKVVVLTGGTHGIGASCAVKLAELGAKLVIVARNGNPGLVESLQSKGAELLMVSADVGKEEDCLAAVTDAQAQWGRIDALVHCAGGGVSGDLLTVDKSSWYAAFDVHVHAAFHLCRAVVPSMKATGGGAITLVSSAAGIRGVKNAIAYAVVKGALPQFARAMAFELADHGIRVNCVSPGIIRTRFHDALSEEQAQNNINHRIPLHREGTPDQVADLIAHLLSNEYISGENVVIDGGLTMRIA